MQTLPPGLPMLNCQSPSKLATTPAPGVGRKPTGRRLRQNVEVICVECKQQLGLEATRDAHPNLREPSKDLLHPDYLTRRFQRLYSCSVCPTVLSRGRNTGWTAVFSMIAASPQ